MERRITEIGAGILGGLVAGVGLALAIHFGASIRPVGFSLGLLIGIVTGMTLMLLIRTAISGDPASHPRTFAILGELLTMPTFWFGGPWLSGSLLKIIDLHAELSTYIVALTVTWGILAAYPLMIVLVNTGRRG